jgi:hypothetical protein
MSGIMSMFSNMLGGQPAPAGAAPAGNTAPANTPGSIPATAPNTGATAPGTAPNGVNPGNADGNPKPDATPLDQFTDLWKNEPVDPNAPNSNSIFGDIDPKKFMEAAGKIDFTKVVTPEQLQKITAGGEDAMASFAQALNAVAQSTYAQSAFASTKIVEQALQKAQAKLMADLPSHIKKQTVSDSLRSENPVFANPAVQPIISALESQLTVKFPNASAPEITQMARQYVEALGTSFAPKPQAPESTGRPGTKEETDWSTFLS